MKIEEQVLSREQMKHLQELGVDTSDASMVWVKQEPPQNSDDEFVPWKVFVFNDWMKYYIGAEIFIPTYTLGDLIEKLQKVCVSKLSLAYFYDLMCFVVENHKELLEVKK